MIRQGEPSVHATNYKDELWALVYDQYNQGRHQMELAFYESEVKDCAGPVLEVACGTGMILLKLLQQGVDVYGFDVSEEMLEILYAKAQALGLDDIRRRVSRQDMRDLSYDYGFDAVLIPARSFLHLTDQGDQIRCLKRIHAHLEPGGRLLLNFFNPRLDLILARSSPGAGYEPRGTFAHPATGQPVELSFKQVNDVPAQVQHITWRFRVGERVHETDMTVRWIYREEFKLLLRVAGFEKWELYGDFDKSGFTPDSQEMIWIAEK